MSDDDDILPGYNRISNIVKHLYDYGDVSPDVLKKAGRRGTRVHSAIDLYIKTGIEDHRLEEGDKLYFESWRLWFEGEVFCGETKKILHGETRLYDQKRWITGQFDGIWNDNGKMVLVDWKTSYAHNDLAWSMQGTGYLQLVKMNNFCECSDTVCFLKLLKDGHKAKEYVYDINKRDHQWFNKLVKDYGRPKIKIDVEEEKEESEQKLYSKGIVAVAI